MATLAAQVVNPVDQILKGARRSEKQSVELDDVGVQRAQQRKIDRGSSKTAQGDHVSTLAVRGDGPRKMIDVLNSVRIDFEGDPSRAEPASVQNLLESQPVVAWDAHDVSPIDLEQQRTAYRMGQVAESVQRPDQTVHPDKLIIVGRQDENGIRADRVAGAQAEDP